MATNWQDHQLVIDIGAEGTYDTIYSTTPTVIKDGSTYKMWYSGYDGTNLRIIYATSTNGTIWTGHTMVLNIGAEGTYDTSHTYYPIVIKDGSTYKMWYSGYDGTNNRTIYATSTNGTTWTGHTLVINIGDEGTYDTSHAYAPSVIKDGSTYKMWYAGSDGTNFRIIYCTSTNGTAWTGHTMVVDKGSEGTYDTISSYYPSVIKDGSTYKMWYSGFNASNVRTIYTTSTNGTTWTGYTMVVDIGAEGTYDTTNVYYPSVIKDGSTYKMWYTGNDGTNYRIIYAIDTSEVTYIAKIGSIAIANISKVSTVAIANVASIHGVGAVPPTEAGSWASWDETSEAGLASDKTFVILMENTSANGNETGVGGGLTGSDLVLTRAGTIAGATGSPPTREIAVNGSNYFTATTGLADGLFTGSTYTFICKVNNLGSMGGEDHYFLIARDAGYSKIFGIGLENSPAGACTEAMSCYSGLNYTSSTPNTTGDVYFAIWYDGTYLRWGFTDSGSKPTKWSDFTSTDRGSWTGSCGYTSGDFTIIKFGARENTSAPLAPSYYYFVCSKSVLIDNDS